MATEIGSAAWVDELDGALAALDTGDVEVTVLHRVDGGAAWLLTVSGGRVRATPAEPATTADLTFTWQLDDAEAVAGGEVSPLVAFQAGRLRVGGDIARLGEVASVFARFTAAGRA